LLDNSANASDKLPKLMNQFESSLAAANEASKNLRSLSKAGNQSLQDLSQQTLPAAQQILVKLNHSLDNIEQLSAELTRNPAVLVRGRPPATTGPGEH
jgi:ABC-type transporter Mla subunit MlaD